MKLLKAFWRKLRTPSKAAVGLVLALGFIGGILFWGLSTPVWKPPIPKPFVLAAMRQLWLKYKKPFTIPTVQGKGDLLRLPRTT